MIIKDILHTALPIVFKWSTLSSGEKIGEAIKVLLEIGGLWEFVKFVDRRLFKRRSQLELRNEVLEEECNARKKTIDDLNRKLAEAIGKLPETALAKAAREWRDRNDDSAIRELEAWLAGVHSAESQVSEILQ